jgi:hypothetical protein
MCYPDKLAAENSSEDVFDLIIFEPERAEIEIAFRTENANFNNAFEFSQNTYGIQNAPIAFDETLTNFIEEESEFFPEDFIEECEIQAILRGEY